MADTSKVMFAELRRQEIVRHVQKHGKATVEDLCQMFSVSPATIRNDLTELENQGRLQRTHGGAIYRNPAGYELTTLEKAVKNVKQKEAIARRALDLIHPGDVIALDSGTTTYELAKLLHTVPNLTVITNDLRICAVLEPYPEITVIMLGGMVRHNFHCTYGSTALDTLDSFYIDTAFVATNGFSVERGLSTPRIEMAEIKHKMIRVAGRAVLMADSTKAGKEAFVSVSPLEEIDVLITDSAMDREFAASLSELGLEVIVAEEN